jgi:hypothetical protein
VAREGLRFTFYALPFAARAAMLRADAVPAGRELDTGSQAVSSAGGFDA